MGRRKPFQSVQWPQFTVDFKQGLQGGHWLLFTQPYSFTCTSVSIFIIRIRQKLIKFYKNCFYHKRKNYSDSVDLLLGCFMEVDLVV